MKTGKSLEMLRERHGITKKEMGALLNVTETAIVHYERTTKLSLQRLKRYCKVLNENEILNKINELEEML